MIFPGFIGSSNTTRSPFTNRERCVNLNCEVSEVPGAKAQIVMYARQGLRNSVSTGLGRSRAFFEQNGRTFEVKGSTLIEWLDTNPMTYTSRGTIADDGLQATISSNGVELFVTGGGNGYILTLATNVLAQITAAAFPGASMGAFLDGYFIALKPNSRQINVSGLYDGATWPADAYTVISNDTDNLVGIIVDHNQLWVWGGQNGHLYQDTGNPTFPFEQTLSPGSQVETGLAAPFSLAQLDNAIFLLDANSRGQGTVYRLQGYLPQRISTHAVEFAIEGYATIADAIAWTYDDQGHSFYVLYFPTAGKTWQYDVSTGLWNEMTFYNSTTGIEEAHRGSAHVFAFGKHLIGDRANGKLYEASIDAYDDDGEPIERIRQCPHVSVEQKWIFYKMLQLDMEVGIGLDGIPPPASGDPDPVGYNPKVMLQYSDDAGNSWSNARWMSAGRLGQYKRRVRWLRLGKSRDRIFRVKMTEAVKTNWIQAFIEFDIGTS